MMRRLVKVSSIVAAGALASGLMAGAAQADEGPQPRCVASGTAYAPPGGAWGPESKAGSYTGGTAAEYGYAVKGNVPGPVAVQGQGIPPNGVGVAWYGLPPIGSAGTGQGTVPWVPNHMAMLGLKASSASINGVFVGWGSPAGC